MVPTEDRSEDDEQEQDHDKDSVDRLDVLSRAPLQIVSSVRIVIDSLSVTLESQFEGNYLGQSLEEKEQPKFAVVELTDTRADPETVMVEFAHASVTVPAMSASERLHLLASITEALFGQCNLLNYTKKNKFVKLIIR